MKFTSQLNTFRVNDFVGMMRKCVIKLPRWTKIPSPPCLSMSRDILKRHVKEIHQTNT